MKKQYDNTELDRLIRKSISRQDIPSPVLNNSLKAELYSREAAMRKTSPAKKLSLWYLPMTVNLIIFLLLVRQPLLQSVIHGLHSLLQGSVVISHWPGSCLLLLGSGGRTLRTRSRYISRKEM